MKIRFTQLFNSKPVILSLFLLGIGFSSQSSNAIETRAVKLADFDNQAGQNKGLVASVAEDTLIDCNMAVPTTDKEACAQSSYSFSKNQLNQTYKLIMHFMRLKIARDTEILRSHPNDQFAKDLLRGDSITEARLVTSQRAWDQFRDANCYLVAASTSIGGSGEGTENFNCLNAMTLNRINELNKISSNLFERQ